MTRTGSAERSTAETTIRIRVDLDGTGQARVATPIGFLDHVLTLFARHALIDLEVDASGVHGGHDTIGESAAGFYKRRDRVGHDLAGAHQHDVLREERGFSHIVRHQQHRLAEALAPRAVASDRGGVPRLGLGRLRVHHHPPLRG